MWVIAEYQPTTLFSLRPATATSSGGKSLIAPTPFAIKMALLDVAIRTQGLEQARQIFAPLRDLRIGLRLPDQIVVNSTFTKIQRLKEFKTPAAEKPAAMAAARANQQWPFQRTIAYREYVQFNGPLHVAFQGMELADLTPLLLQINYLGKRGGFMQLMRAPHETDVLPDQFTEITAGIGNTFILGFLQALDDFGPTMMFEHADIYSDTSIRLGKERIFRHVILPYRLQRSSRSFALYQRIGPT